MSELKEVVLATGVEEMKESKAAQRLGSIVEKMMEDMEHTMGKLYEEKQVNYTLMKLKLLVTLKITSV